MIKTIKRDCRDHEDIYMDGWCLQCIEDAINNIKNRKLERTTRTGEYDLSNWVKDWKWMTDPESDFATHCMIAGYGDSEILINETLRLAKARIEDGVKLERAWLLGEDVAS